MSDFIGRANFTSPLHRSVIRERVYHAYMDEVTVSSVAKMRLSDKAMVENFVELRSLRSMSDSR